jgi:hypothetical protein
MMPPVLYAVQHAAGFRAFGLAAVCVDWLRGIR